MSDIKAGYSVHVEVYVDGPEGRVSLADNHSYGFETINGCNVVAMGCADAVLGVMDTLSRTKNPDGVSALDQLKAIRRGE